MGAPPGYVYWIGAGFPLGLVCLILVLGTLFNIFDMKWVYIATVVLFEGGSDLCGAAPNSMNADCWPVSSPSRSILSPGRLSISLSSTKSSSLLPAFSCWVVVVPWWLIYGLSILAAVESGLSMVTGYTVSTLTAKPEDAEWCPNWWPSIAGR